MSNSLEKMPTGRVMLVDDSIIVRTIVSRWVNSDPHLEVVSSASSGAKALASLELSQPDVVVLDVEMPNMNGLQVLTELLNRRPNIEVVMFSTLTERGAATTLDALSKGARDYLAKPASLGGATDELERIKQGLLSRLRHFARRAQNRRNGLAGRTVTTVPPTLRSVPPIPQRVGAIADVAISGPSSKSSVAAHRSSAGSTSGVASGAPASSSGISPADGTSATIGADGPGAVASSV